MKTGSKLLMESTCKWFKIKFLYSLDIMEQEKQPLLEFWPAWLKLPKVTRKFLESICLVMSKKLEKLWEFVLNMMYFLSYSQYKNTFLFSTT